MARKGSKKNRRSQKGKRSQRRSQRRSQKRQSGGGYSELLNNSIYPGQQIHQQYSGPGYDCPGVPTRSGTLTDQQMIPLRIAGLPGLQKGGGSCGATPQDMIQQAQQLGSGGPAILGVSVANGSQPGSYSAALDAPALPVTRSYPMYSQMKGGRRSRKRRQQKQQGGRWGAFPELGNLNQQNGVGTIGSPFLRQPCELGSYNPSLPNPGNVQQLSTAQGWVPGWTPYAPALKGGKRRLKKKSKNPMKILSSRINVPRNAPTRRRRQQGGMTNFQQYPQVSVGAADSMRIYSPTAGYGNYPMSPQVANNPGIQMQVGYPARHLNEACIKSN
jgi:hypothetical protein